jgi:CheY-like chemotaxis protein
LLDIGLPGMNGYEVAAALSQEDGCRDAVIIGVSGYGEAAARDKARQAGFHHHLTKPLDFDKLDDILRHLPS